MDLKVALATQDTFLNVFWIFFEKGYFILLILWKFEQLYTGSSEVAKKGIWVSLYWNIVYYENLVDLKKRSKICTI